MSWCSFGRRIKKSRHFESVKLQGRGMIDFETCRYFGLAILVVLGHRQHKTFLEGFCSLSGRSGFRTLIIRRVNISENIHEQNPEQPTAALRTISSLALAAIVSVFWRTFFFSRSACWSLVCKRRQTRSAVLSVEILHLTTFAVWIHLPVMYFFGCV